MSEASGATSWIDQVLSVEFGVLQAVQRAADVWIPGRIERQIDVVHSARREHGGVPSRRARRAERIFPFGGVGAVGDVHVAIGIHGDGSRAGRFVDVFAFPVPHLSARYARRQQRDGCHEQPESRTSSAGNVS